MSDFKKVLLKRLFSLFELVGVVPRFLAHF
jgi:hypothetical protein